VGKAMGHNKEIEIVPNGVDLKNFTRDFTEDELLSLKVNLKKRTEDVFLITTSRLVKKNAVGDVISALPHLPSHIKFIVIGEGPDKDKLSKLVKDLKLENRVTFVGHIDHKDIPKYLKVSDIFIRPSLSEGFGNSFIEAMASKIPVIATPVGGIVDFLKSPAEGENPTGLFCKPNNPTSIANTVEAYLNDEGLRNKIVDNAYKMVTENYDWTKISHDMRNKVFNKILGE
jgi:glycosyltransferase involved in cell wall biosynthesis